MPEERRTMDFVAIDFETANHSPSSACQLAAVVVRKGKIAEEHCWLIRPPRSYFAPQNIQIHGIRLQDVTGAPTMAGVWKELQPLIDSQIIVAHNARFDIGVLSASLDARSVECPDLDFTCTRLLAKRAWPGKARYGLKPLGDSLGIQFQHHDALEDARCCANICLAIAATAESTNMDELEENLRIHRGSLRSQKITSPRFYGGAPSMRAAGMADRYGFPTKASARASRLDADSVLIASARKKPLDGRHITLIGALGGMSRDESIEFVQSLGAVVDETPCEQTDFLIACQITVEEARAELDKLKTTQCRPRVLSQRQFRALLPAGKSTTNW